MSVQLNTYATDDGVMGTLVLTVHDPGAEVETVRFRVTGGSGVTSGPVAADRVSAGVFEKDVPLAPDTETLIEPVVTLKQGGTVPADAQSFPRLSGRVITLVQGAKNERGTSLEIGTGLTLARSADGLRPLLSANGSGSGAGGALSVQDSDTSAVTVGTLAFQGPVVSVTNGVATVNLDSRYALLSGAAFTGNISAAGGQATLGVGGSGNPKLELGISTVAGTAPFIDFQYGVGVEQPYNARLANNGDNLLTLMFAGSGTLNVQGTIQQNGAAVSLAGHAHDDRYYTEAEADARFLPLNGAISDAQLSANIPRFGAGGVFTGAAQLAFQTGATGWNGWNVPLALSNASHAAIAATGVNLLMGFHSDGNFYWADTTPGSGGSRMRLDRAGNLSPAGAVVATGYPGYLLQLGGTRSAGRGTITETPNLHLDSRDGSGIFLNYFNSTAATNVGGIIQTAYKLAVNGDLAAYGGGWFHNMAAGSGLVNDATGTRFYAASADKWRMSSSTGMAFYAADNATVRGYVYHDVSGFGLLGSNHTWGLRVLPGGGTVESVGAFVPSGGVYLTASQAGHAGTGPALYFDSNASLAYSIRKQNTYLDRTGQFATLVINNHTGIKLGAHPIYGGVQFYSDWVGSGSAALIATFGYGDNTHLNMFGPRGILFADYGGGWYMQDTTWIRAIGDKNVWLGSGSFGSNGRITLGYDGVMDANYRVYANGRGYFATGVVAGGGNTPQGNALLHNTNLWSDNQVNQYPTVGGSGAVGGLAQPDGLIMLVRPHIPMSVNDGAYVRMASHRNGGDHPAWDMGTFGDQWAVRRGYTGAFLRIAADGRISNTHGHPIGGSTSGTAAPSFAAADGTLYLQT